MSRLGESTAACKYMKGSVTKGIPYLTPNSGQREKRGLSLHLWEVEDHGPADYRLTS